MTECPDLLADLLATLQAATAQRGEVSMTESCEDLVAGKMYRVMATKVHFLREAEDGAVMTSVVMPEESYRARGVPHIFEGVFRARVGSVLQWQVSGYYTAFVTDSHVKSIHLLRRS